MTLQQNHVQPITWLFEVGFYNYFWQTTSLCPIPIRGASPGSTGSCLIGEGVLGLLLLGGRMQTFHVEEPKSFNESRFGKNCAVTKSVWGEEALILAYPKSNECPNYTPTTKCAGGYTGFALSRRSVGPSVRPSPIRVRSITPLLMEGFFSNLNDTFTSTWECAEPMSPMSQLKVKVTVKGQIFNKQKLHIMWCPLCNSFTNERISIKLEWHIGRSGGRAGVS